jgi:hypothetical protein
MIRGMQQGIFKWPATSQELVQDCSHPIDIGGWREFCLDALLRGHIRVCPEALPRALPRLQAIRDIKIDEDRKPAP